MISLISLPTVIGMSHQPSLQARIERLVHSSANWVSRSLVRQGMAPGEWLIIFTVWALAMGLLLAEAHHDAVGSGQEERGRL